jgi:hypothetical protein
MQPEPESEGVHYAPNGALRRGIRFSDTPHVSAAVLR